MTPTDLSNIAATSRNGQASAGTQRSLLRIANERDRPALLALHQDALRALSGGHYSQAQIGSLLRHVPTLDESLIADRTYLVAELDGLIVACGGWSAREPGYLPSIGQARCNPDGSNAPLIRAMYTRPSHARRGLARQVLAAAARAANSRYPQPLELDALLSGVPLYLAAGYELLGRTTWRLPDGEEIAVVRMRQRRSHANHEMRTIQSTCTPPSSTDRGETLT